MPYLVFNSRTEADAANHKISKAVGTKGCRGVVPRCLDCVSDPSDTKFWFSYIVHPSDGRVALVLDDIHYLSTEQTSMIVESLSADWFLEQV